MVKPAERSEGGTLGPQGIARAREAVARVARVTPVLESWTLAERAGAARVVLKAENLQRTGSFKLRGAAAKRDALGPLETVAVTRANVVDVEHVREGVELHVRETAVQLVLETRGPSMPRPCSRRSPRAATL